MIRFVICLFLGCCLTCASAQVSVLAERNCSKAMGAIYSFDESAYNLYLSRVSDPAIKAYLKEYHALMNYAAANNTANYKIYDEAASKALDAIAGHPYEDALTCNLQIHRTLVELSSGSLIGGGIQFWKSYRSFRRGEEKYPGYDGQLMLRGFFDVLLSQIPDRWKSLAGFFGFGEGNLAKGFKEINDYHLKVREVDGLNEESLLLAFANIFLSLDQQISDSQRQEIRRNQAPIIVYAYLLSCGRRMMGNEAVWVLNHLKPGVREHFPLIWQQESKFALRGLDTENTRRYADLFARNYKGASCANEAPLLKAYSLALDGNMDEAKRQAKFAATLPTTSDVDERIHNDALRFEEMNVTMMKARFQFEYGDYAGSLATLMAYKPTPDLAIEYYFRLGRAEEKLGRNNEALTYYDKVISMSANNKRYFGPYSAVYAADIYIHKGDMAKAKKYVEMAKKLNNGEFSKEIDQRISLSTRAVSGDK